MPKRNRSALRLEGYMLVPEPKSKRRNLLIQPTLDTFLTNFAKKRGISVNETMNMAIKEFRDRHEGE